MLDVALAAEEAAEQQETDWALHELGAARVGRCAADGAAGAAGAPAE
jgi:hypothetical protein